VATGDRLVFTAWSRDGSYVYYEQRKPRKLSTYYPEVEGLWRVSVSGGRPELVATNVSNFVGESPERGWILFTRERPEPRFTEDVWMARSDGSDARMLFAEHYIDYPLGWAPGRRGAYLVGRAKKLPLPLLLFPTSGGRRNLGRIGYGGIFWSRDGRTIAWDDFERKIGLMNEDGSDRKTLLHLRGDVVLGDGPHWTPDGRTLLFETGIIPD
jgi:Tol biopolymer transport system component